LEYLGGAWGAVGGATRGEAAGLEAATRGLGGSIGLPFLEPIWKKNRKKIGRVVVKRNSFQQGFREHFLLSLAECATIWVQVRDDSNKD